jgi:hypothetical protein
MVLDATVGARREDIPAGTTETTHLQLPIDASFYPCPKFLIRYFLAIL